MCAVTTSGTWTFALHVACWALLGVRGSASLVWRHGFVRRHAAWWLLPFNHCVHTVSLWCHSAPYLQGLVRSHVARWFHGWCKAVWWCHGCCLQSLNAYFTHWSTTLVPHLWVQIWVQDVYGNYFLCNHAWKSCFMKRKTQVFMIHMCFPYSPQDPEKFCIFILREECAILVGCFLVCSSKMVVLTPLPKICCNLSPSHTIS